MTIKKNKTLTVNRSDIQGPFVTPPETAHMRGAAAYACTEDYILVSEAGEVMAHAWPARGEFEPQNGTPKLGRKVGTVTIREQ